MTDAWVPDACTLPTVEQPLRVAEFDELFAAALRSHERVSPTRLRLIVDPAAEQQARDLCARESQCCAFLTFTFGMDERGVLLDVDVPAAQAGVLDAIADQVSIQRQNGWPAGSRQTRTSS